MMEGNSVIQLINDMVMNGDLIRNLPIKGEVSIADAPGYKTILTDAVITGIITATATYIGAIIGSKNTIKLFKQQEKFKLREKLRIEFYFDYEKLYLNMYDELKNLISNLLEIRFELYLCGKDDSTYDFDNLVQDIKISWINNAEDIDQSLKNIKEKDIDRQINKLKLKIKELKEFMDLKSYISGHSRFIYNKLESEIVDLSYKLDMLHISPIVSEELHLREQGEPQKNIEEEQVYNYVNCLEELMNEYLRRIVKMKEEISIIHKTIKSEIIEGYFED